MIRIENLVKKYGDTVATDIPALTIDKGEIWGLVGNNGAGKTTLLRLMLDLLEPDKGQIFSNSSPVSKSDHWKDYTGSFIDNNFLIEFLTPKEYFEFIGRIYGLKKDQLYDKLSTLNHFFSTSQPEAGKYIRKLSSGFKQKTGIVGALLSTPEVLILDEPYNFLDPSSQILLNKILLSYFQNETKTIILSSHNLKHISDICTRIALMDSGKIIKDVPNTVEAMAAIEDYFKNQTES